MSSVSPHGVRRRRRKRLLRLLCWTIILLLTLAGARLHAQTQRSSPTQIRFRVGSSRIDHALERNGEKLAALLWQIYSLRLDSCRTLQRIVLDGSASPEGGAALNARLCRARAQALEDHIRSRIPLPDSLFVCEDLRIDWQMLRDTIRTGAPAWGERVLSLLDAETRDEERQRRIAALDGGSLYRHLLAAWYPGMRYASARLIYACRPAPQPPRSAAPAAPVPLPPEAEPAAVETVPAPRIAAEPARAPRYMAAKTNLLFWAAAGANIGVEIQAGDRFSFDIPFWYSPWDLSNKKRLRLLATQPEVRFWLCEAFTGHFFGVHFHIVGYNVSINDRGRWQDDNRPMYGAGISYGYAFDLGRRWGLELNLGAGYAHTTYNKYRNVPNGEWLEAGSKDYWGVTRAGVSLTYKFRIR